MGIKNDFSLRVGDRSWFCGVRADACLVFMYASKLTCFLGGSHNWLRFLVLAEITLFQCMERN